MVNLKSLKINFYSFFFFLFMSNDEITFNSSQENNTGQYEFEDIIIKHTESAKPVRKKRKKNNKRNSRKP